MSGCSPAAQVGAATQVKTTVTILNGNGERFTGSVTPPNKACRKGRKINLYMKISARRNYGYKGYEVVGKATTRSNGRWEIKRSAAEAFQEGDYRAFVASKRVKSGGQSLLCMSGWGQARHA